jgi:D-alanyl-D-alanine carboxypeptidase
MRGCCSRVAVRLLTIALATCPAWPLQAATTEEAVGRYVKEQMRKSHTPGVSVGVIRRGEVVLAKGYGLANVELEVPATKDTVYELLSVGKQFTAAAILLLVEEGKVSLDEAVSAYLPDAPDAWKGVKVRHLLSHTSGITDYTDIRPFFENICLDATPDELMKPVKARPLDFEPGTRSRYSNSNYYVLGMIIERAGRMTYADFLAKRVFAPLGMRATRVNDLRDIIPGRASGYHWLGEDAEKLPPFLSGYHGVKNVLQNAVYVSPTRKWAAGAVVSSVTDMARWEAAIVGGKLLKRATWEQMAIPARLSSRVETGYGLGTELSTRNGHRLSGYQGGGMAFNGTFLRRVDGELAVIVLCNQTSAPSRAMAVRIASFYDPDLSYERMKGIEDKDPEVTKLLRAALIDAQRGKADEGSFAPDALRTAAYIRRVGPDFLGRLGVLKLLVLLERREEPTQRVFTYRAEFAEATIVWSFTLNRDGKIISLEPLEE